MYREGDHGYLKSVLQLLDIPVSSQTLVFSKTSFQYPKISPRHPRALYFNDDIYIGAVHEGKEIEVVSFDKQQGAMFFILHEQKADKPRFERAELDCTQCHIAAATRGVPGVMLRSVQPNSTGTPVSGTKNFISDQESPLNERWGGWYVTGPLAQQTLANLAAPADATAKTVTLEAIPETFDPKAFLAPGSDDVALLVLGHRTQMHNLITLTNYRTRIALHDAGLKAGDEFRRICASASEARGAVVALSAVLQRDAPPGSRRCAGDRGFRIRARIRGTRAVRLEGSLAAPVRPEHAHLQVPAQLSHLLRCLRRAAGTGQGLRLSPPAAGSERRGSEPAVRGAVRRQPESHSEILLQTKSGLPQEWTDYARANQLRVADRTTSSKRSNKWR